MAVGGAPVAWGQRAARKGLIFYCHLLLYFDLECSALSIRSYSSSVQFSLKVCQCIRAQNSAGVHLGCWPTLEHVDISY